MTSSNFQDTYKTSLESFYRSKPEFCLISNAAKPEFTIHLEDMVLKIAKVKVNPSMQNP